MSRNRLRHLASILWCFKGTMLIQIVIVTIGLLTREQTAESITAGVDQAKSEIQALQGSCADTLGS